MFQTRSVATKFFRMMVVLKFSEAKDLKDLPKDRLDQEKNTMMSRVWSSCKRGLVYTGILLCFWLVLIVISWGLVMMRTLERQVRRNGGGMF